MEEQKLLQAISQMMDEKLEEKLAIQKADIIQMDESLPHRKRTSAMRWTGNLPL